MIVFKLEYLNKVWIKNLWLILINIKQKIKNGRYSNNMFCAIVMSI